MSWQPMKTAPKDGEPVWVTRVWSGIRIVARDYYPYRADALAWQPIDWEPPEPDPYTGPVEDLPASPDVDPRDAEIERLRAEVERLRNALPSTEEIDYLRRSLPSYGSTSNVYLRRAP